MLPLRKVATRVESEASRKHTPKTQIYTVGEKQTSPTYLYSKATLESRRPSQGVPQCQPTNASQNHIHSTQTPIERIGLETQHTKSKLPQERPIVRIARQPNLMMQPLRQENHQEHAHIAIEQTNSSTASPVEDTEDPNTWQPYIAT